MGREGGFEQGNEDCVDLTQNHDGAGDADEDVPAITHVNADTGTLKPL
jgi:hypothetical protein